MYLVNKAKRKSTWVFLLVLLVTLTVAAFSFVIIRSQNLSEFGDQLRLAFANNAAWGTLQLGQDVMRFERAVHDVTMHSNQKTRKELQTRNDLLYSRFEVVSAGIRNSMKIHAEFSEAVLSDYNNLHESYLRADELVQQYIKNPDFGKLGVLEELAQDMVPESAYLASQLNQYIEDVNYKIQNRTLNNMKEYQILLMVIFAVFFCFSFIALFMYVKAVNVNKEIEKTAADLSKASQAKTHFLSSMSHELRTPLNAIIGFAQFLELKNLKRTPEKDSEYTEYILSSANQLLELINQVLDLEKIENGEIEIEKTTFELKSLIDGCIEMSQSLSEKFNIEIIWKDSCSLTLHTDDLRLRQILLNFISNGVKYNKPGGHVHVVCSLCENGRVRIDVTDTGMGIPEAKRQLLFLPFERLGREARNIEGTGIGLNISQSIAENLGYGIGYEPGLGGGSTFWVEIPSNSVV